MSFETIPGGASKTQNGDWVNANGEPLSNDQIKLLEGDVTPSVTALEDHTKAELLELARERGITADARMSKADVIAALES